MNQDHLPTPLARAVMRVAPASLLQKSIDALLRSMRTSHPNLFKNLARLKPSVVLIEPTDLPHCFTLSFGGEEASLAIAESRDVKCTARIKGTLDTLLSMMEGRSDGDMMFFSRSIEITGDTSVIVALRNTIDREEIDLLDDITAMFGPFARPVRKLAVLADGLAQHVKDRIVEICEERRAAQPEDSAAKRECESLRAEVQALKTRLAKLEVHRKRTEAHA